jgi:hypothetical protein
MKNVQGWSDKIEQRTFSEGKKELSVEDARKKIESIAPQLLEMLKNSQVVNQLTVKEEVVDAEIV